MSRSSWICIQLGAREHYAIPRALHSADLLHLLLTDCWIKPFPILNNLSLTRRLSDRFHFDLHQAPLKTSTISSIFQELYFRFDRSRDPWTTIILRNQSFMKWSSNILRRLPDSDHTIFSYSYTALSALQISHRRGWPFVLGQIDPGYFEEQIVSEEHRLFPQYDTNWRPAPDSYWQSWFDELSLANHIVVNSQWSYNALISQGVPKNKLRIIPLTFTATKPDTHSLRPQRQSRRTFNLLFLGTICLRKGIARLLVAMEYLQRHPIHLTLAGPTEVDPICWSHLNNVRWVGSVPRSQVAHYYREADAMILPTLSDGFALTQLESIAFGCPVITSMNCGNVVSDGCNGWILPSLDPKVISETILHALDTIDSLSMSSERPLFTLHQLAESMLEIT